MPGRKLAVGDRVRVKFGIKCPTHNWGKVNPGEVGTIISITGKKCKVDFPTACKWTGVLKEMEYMGNPAGELLMGMYENLLKDRNFADVTFVLSDGEELAHRAVLAASSDVFAAMFMHSMREEQARKVELPDVKCATMRIFLRLLYTGHIDPHDWQDAGKDVDLDHRTDATCRSPKNTRDENRGGANPCDSDENDGPGQAAGASHAQAVAAGDTTTNGQDEDEDSEDEEDEDEDEDDEYATGDDEDEIAGADEKKVPLDALFDVTGLSKKYMVERVLQSTIEALKSRLHRAWVHGDMVVFEDIMASAINMDIGAVRIAAMELARKSRALRKAFNARKLRPEVQLELQALWPPPVRKAKRACLT